MDELRPKDFSSFFKAVYRYDPFPWQVRLAEKVTEEDGCWPQAISLPTASGKTACIDVAVFAMALQADWQHDRIRTAPRRIFFVVDRRVIVDEAYVRGRDLAKRLRHATPADGILWQVAERLKRLAIGQTGPFLNGDQKSTASATGSVAAWLGNQPPLMCYQMRGGIYRDHAWARTPTQPTIITSTVDQIGSRLLYRGYGVSEFSRPIHAGLTANDSLIILDEAHCSHPFNQTMQSIREYRLSGRTEAADKIPFHFVALSATPSATAKDIFKIEADDEAQASHQELARRIHAVKKAKLVVAEKAKGMKWLKPMATQIADQAESLQKESGAQAIGIIVNRVATAREVRNLLKSRVGSEADTVLMTGRMREVDRRGVLAIWQPLLSANPLAESPRRLDRPVFVVATQCLEVGANLDFDAMIAECASLDALRQRFGRLNRLGQRDVALAAIVVRGDQAEVSEDPKKHDPVYGPSLSATWQWLKQHSTNGAIDLGIASINSLLPADDNERNILLRTLQPIPANAPVMLPSHLNALVQTSPSPCPDPDISLFLHGPQRATPDIQVCWRADLIQITSNALATGTRSEAGNDNSQHSSQKATWIEALALCPPTAAECLTVRLHDFTNWIATGRTDVNSLTDLEGVNDSESEEALDSRHSRRFLRWCGPADQRTDLLTDATRLRPGDTVVLPTWLGGFDILGDLGALTEIDAMKDPQGAARADCGDSANIFARFTPVLRINGLLASQWPECAGKTKLIAMATDKILPERFLGDDFSLELAEALSDLATSVETQTAEFAWLRVAAASLASQIVRTSREKGNKLRPQYLRPRLCLMPYGWMRGDDEGILLLDPVSPGGFVICGRKLTNEEAAGLFDTDSFDEFERLTADSFTHEDISSSTVAPRTISLREHTAGVVEFISHFTSACRLSPQIISDLKLAARLHDLGKSDPRFQAWLRGGNVREARLAGELLAKSNLSGDRTSIRLARERSGYPSGGRHELLSVRLVENSMELLKHAHDPELVIYLLQSHHGACRPLAPVVEDHTWDSLQEPFNILRLAEIVGVPAANIATVLPAAVLPTGLENIASGTARRFWEMVRRYGWWGIAWLETLLILSDRCESQFEQEFSGVRNESDSTI
jgi:CRISPR-associated endonuclease/helicase Cas3